MSDVANYDLWLGRLASMPATFNASFATLGAEAWFNALNTDHDGLFVALQALALHPGNADLIAFRDNCRAAFRDTYLADNPSGPSEPYILTEGLAADWEINGDTASRAALSAMRDTVLFYSDGTGNDVERASRGVAYILLGFVECDRLGIKSWDDRAARVAQLVTWALGHIDIWLGDPQPWIDDWETVNPGSVSYIQAFMMGITATCLAKYDDYLLVRDGARDARILPALARLALRLRERHWRPNGGAGAYTQRGDFIYQVFSDGTFYPDLAAADTADNNADNLNNMVAAFFGWLYARTGLEAFKTWGDESFASAADTPNIFGGKQYDEVNRWAGEGGYLGWRDGGVDAVPTTGFYTADGPFWPRATVGVASGSINVMPVSAVTMTVTPSIAGGTCTPSTLTWAGTAEPKSFTATWATAGSKTVSFANSAGLTNPPSLAFTASGASATLSLVRPGGGRLVLRKGA